MKTPDEIHDAIEILCRLSDSREDIIIATWPNPLPKLVSDEYANDAYLCVEALEWVLGINHDPEGKNILEDLLEKFGND